MSAEFSNVYQEVLLDNLMGVIKQNFLFQAQIKMTESLGKEKEELQKKNEELSRLYNDTKNEVGQLQIYKSKVEQNNSAHEEKNRIQSALNDQMKKNAKMNEEVLAMKKQIDELNEYVSNLEKQMSPSKLKKVKDVVEEEIKVEENSTEKIFGGSSF